MSFLLDTNVVSEWVKRRRDPGLVAWLAEVDEDQTFLSVSTLTELRYGVERLAPGQRRNRLDDWLARELPRRFEGRILYVDAALADRCGRIIARGRAVGRPVRVMDG